MITWSLRKAPSEPTGQVEALFVALNTSRSGSISREDLRVLSMAKRMNDLEMAQQDGEKMGKCHPPRPKKDEAGLFNLENKQNNN